MDQEAPITPPGLAMKSPSQGEQLPPVHAQEKDWMPLTSYDPYSFVADHGPRSTSSERALYTRARSLPFSGGQSGRLRQWRSSNPRTGNWSTPRNPRSDTTTGKTRRRLVWNVDARPRFVTGGLRDKSFAFWMAYITPGFVVQPPCSVGLACVHGELPGNPRSERSTIAHTGRELMGHTPWECASRGRRIPGSVPFHRVQSVVTSMKRWVRMHESRDPGETALAWTPLLP